MWTFSSFQTSATYRWLVDCDRASSRPSSYAHWSIFGNTLCCYHPCACLCLFYSRWSVILNGSFILLDRLYYPSIMHCNFICSLSDVIIKTFSQSVSQDERESRFLTSNLSLKATITPTSDCYNDRKRHTTTDRGPKPQCTVRPPLIASQPLLFYIQHRSCYNIMNC